MLSREDFYMIKQMRQQGAYIVDIATQIGCSERTVRQWVIRADVPCCVTTSSPNVKYVRQKEQFASKLSLDTSSSTTRAKLRWRLPGNGAKLTLRLIRWGSPAASMSSPHQNRMLSIHQSRNICSRYRVPH